MISTHFLIKRKEDLGPLLAGQAGLRIEFKKIICNVTAYFMLIGFMIKERKKKSWNEFLEQKKDNMT